MAKTIISESRLNQLIQEAFDEVMMESLEDEGKLGDLARGAWDGIKKGAQAVGNAYNSAKDTVDKNGGLLNTVAKAAGNMKNKWNNAVDTYRNAAAGLTDNPSQGSYAIDSNAANAANASNNNNNDGGFKLGSEPQPFPMNTAENPQNGETQQGARQNGQQGEQNAQQNQQGGQQGQQQAQSPTLIKKNASMILQKAGFTFDKKSKQWLDAKGVPATKSRSQNVKYWLQQFNNASAKNTTQSQQPSAQGAQQQQQPATQGAQQQQQPATQGAVSESLIRKAVKEAIEKYK